MIHDPVYVTSHGRQFHDPLRHYMTGSSKVSVAPSQAKRLGYEPCAYCFGADGRRPGLRRDASKAYLTLARGNA